MPVTTNTFTNLPGTPLTPQFAEIVMYGHAVESDSGAKPFVNIFNFVRTSGPGTENENDLYAAVAAIWDAAASLCMSDKYIPDSSSVRFMDDPLRAAVVEANGWVGVVSGDRMPTFNAVVIRKDTYARGRSYRGSNHYGPVAESQSTLDNLNAGAVTLWNTFQGNLQTLGVTGVTLGSGSVWKLAVFSPTLSDLVSSPIQVTGSIVQSTILNLRLGTMKRRKDRTGASA